MKTSTPAPYFIRRKSVCECLGLSPTTLGRRMADGLIPPPVSLGGRAIGWIGSEIEQIARYRAAGKPDSDVRRLVDELVRRRNLEGAL